MPSVPTMPGQRLDGDVADAEEDAGGGGEHRRRGARPGAPTRGPMISRRADAEEPGLEGDHRRQREGECAPCVRGHRDAEQHEAGGGEAEAPPLTPADLEAEDAVGHDGDQHDAAGDDGLDDRHRRERERRDVQGPGAGRRRHADREPLERPQRRRAAAAGGGCRPAGPRRRRGACRRTRGSRRMRRASASRMPSWSVMREVWSRACPMTGPWTRTGSSAPNRRVDRSATT